LKAVLRGKSIAVITYIKKQISNKEPNDAPQSLKKKKEKAKI
jgi:hypothetical protein